MVNSVMSAAATTGSWTAPCQPIGGGLYTQSCMTSAGDGTFVENDGVYSDSACTTLLAAATATGNTYNLGASVTWPGVDKLKTTYSSLTYGMTDVTNTNFLPAGCACGGTWVNSVRRTITPADCPACPLLTPDYWLGVYNSSGIYSSDSSKTPATAWAETALDAERYAGLVTSPVTCTVIVNTFPALSGAMSATVSSPLVTLALAVVALVVAKRF